MNEIHEIPLDQIRSAPWNPESRLDSARVKELADSIQKHGQRSAVLVRPIESGNGVKYELVFGHRRFAACQVLGKPVRAEIAEMDDAQAIIVSGIENLQRENFSDYEEAEFILTCSEEYGASAVKILAEKLSVSQPYIRKRLEILKLPEAALNLWRSGVWHVGHMEQLLRLGDDASVLETLEILNRRHEIGIPVYELEDFIDRLSINLNSGNFDKKDCKVCRKSTDCQRKLFDTETEKGKCLDQECFARKQQAWLDVNWATCKGNKYGTQTAVLGGWDTPKTGDFGWDSKPGEKCLSCSHFTTILFLGRGLESHNDNKVCMGEAACFTEIKKSAQAKKEGKKAEDIPRVSWHGEYYRQEFYHQEIPELMASLDPDDPRHLRITLAVMLYSARTLHEWFCEQIGRDDLMPEKEERWHYFRLPFHQLLTLAHALETEQAKKLLAEALVKTALNKGEGYSITFTDEDRQSLAQYLNIDFTRFQVTPEYLQKKTKAEIVRFIAHESGLMQDQDFLVYLKARGLLEGGPEKLAQLKKGALVDLVLKCEVDLHGRLPKEISDLPDLSKISQG